MSRLIKIKDKVVTSDQRMSGGFLGQVIFGTGRHRVEFIDPFGNKSYRTEFEKVLYQDSNIVTIGGYQFAFDKLFNIGLDQQTTLRVGDLNDEAPQMKIGVQRGDYKSIHYNGECGIGGETQVPLNGGINISALNYIFGFMVGDGGAREDNITPIAPNYKNRSLYNPIPFRMSNDRFPLQNGRYFGKSSAFNSASNSIDSYYVKKFDEPAPHIVHSWVTDNPDELSIVDDTVFSSTSSIAIESYVELCLSIDKHDCRGYFTTTNSTPRINEIGLVSGWYNSALNDWEHIRLFTHFTRPNIALADGDSVEGIYRLYAR